MTEPRTDWRKLHGESFAGKRALVTGGAGVIGAHPVEALITLGASVVVLDNLSSGNRNNLAPFLSVKLIESSILDRDAVREATSGAEIIFHEAALASVPMSVERPRDFYEVNVTGTINVLEAAREAK